MRIIVSLICIICIINFIGGVIGTNLPYGYNYFDISASVSGTNLSVLGEDTTGNKYLYLSSDSGSTWRKSSNQFPFTVCATMSSENGQYIYLGIASGSIYISSNWGNQFYETSSPFSAYYMATSATGQYFVACASSYIVVSSSFGETWDYTGLPCAFNPNSVVGSFSMTYNGSYIVAASQGYPVYVSSSYGVHWSTTSLTSGNYYYTTCSSSGQYFYTSFGLLAASSNYGVLWNVIPENNTFSVYPIVASSNGQNLVAVIQTITGSTINQSLWISYDAARNWTMLDAPAIEFEDNNYWTSLAMDSTGAYIFASQNNGTVYIIHQTFPTQTPTSSPTQSPINGKTPVPSVSPTLTVDVQVNNVISGTTYAQYQNAVSAYIDTITQTIVNSTNQGLRNLGSTGYLSESNIFYLTVQPTPSAANRVLTPSAANRVLTPSAANRVLTSSASIQVTYNIQSSMVSIINLTALNIN